MSVTPCRSALQKPELPMKTLKSSGKTRHFLLLSPTHAGEATLRTELINAYTNITLRRVDNSDNLWEALITQPCDVVLIDSNYKKRPIPELLRMIASQDHYIPTIVLTDTLDLNEMKSHLMHGASDCISKTELWRLELCLTRVFKEQVLLSAQRKADMALRQANMELSSRFRELERAKDELVRTKRALEQSNRQLHYDAYHDMLTGLPNRTMFMDRLTHTIERHKRHPEAGFAVLFLDFDRFKIVNDSLGHAVGDEMLKLIGQRLKMVLRPVDTVARFGGDEFSVLLEDTSSIAGVEEVAQRIQMAFAHSLVIAGQEIFTSASIGITSSQLPYTSAADVLRDADIAMYRAKALGKAQYAVFDHAMHHEMMTLLSLEADLRNALINKELTVFYQPIMTTRTGQCSGYEALVRWDHPQHGIISPPTFIAIAEEMGLIIEIDRYVLKEACRQGVRWQQTIPGADFTMSVNLSSRHFMIRDLVPTLKHILKETGFNPAKLKLEMTEATLMTHSDTVKDVLMQIKTLGIALHIDDFGTGYSSLSYLQKLPIDAIKIDRTFVMRMIENSESAELVRTIIAMAQNLELSVVAEGVETLEQYETLKELECPFVQGFLFSEPRRAKDADRFLLA